ncbi:24975_t:CDS:2, partial [Cetraspora pellucida]
TPTQSNMKGIARMLDIIFENLNETNFKLNHINEVFEQYQETITSHLYSENIDKAAFKFNLEKPLGDRYNQDILNNYIKFYQEDYLKRSE